MGMYHKNHFVGAKRKRYIKRQTSRGMRRAAKKSCRPEQEERITLTSKSRNLHGYSSRCLVKVAEKTGYLDIEGVGMVHLRQMRS